MTLVPLFARHGIRLRTERLAEDSRAITAALDDPRPLNADAARRRNVRDAKRELRHTLDVLERWVVAR